MKVTLYNKTKPVLELETDGRHVLKIGKVLEEQFLPIPLKENLSLQTVNHWFKKRQIPQEREGIATARRSFLGFETNKNYFSLTDQYWLKTNVRENWKKLNYFTNQYSTQIGDIFFYPWKVEKKNITPNPDLTISGKKKKRWIQNDMQSILIKAGGGIEPLCEYMASETLKKFQQLSYVEYSLDIEGMQFVSKSQNFVDEMHEFISAEQLYYSLQKKENDDVYTHFLRLFEKYNFDAQKDLDKMILADYIVFNSERSLDNFGFLRNVESGNIIGMAPVFGFGSAFFGRSDVIDRQPSRLFPTQETTLVKHMSSYIDMNNLYPEVLDSVMDNYPWIQKNKADKIKKLLTKKMLR